MASAAKQFDFDINDYSVLLSSPVTGTAAPKKAPSGKPAQKPYIVREKPRTKSELKKSAKYSRRATLKVLAVACVMLVLVGMLIMGRVMVVEYTVQAQELAARYDEAVSENVRLTSEAASMYSTGNIADYAENELGMVKKDDFKPNYYSVD